MNTSDLDKLPDSVYSAMLTGIRTIRKARDQERLVVFVGSGVSYNSNVPGWENLVESMAKDLGISDYRKDRDYLIKIPQHYYRERQEKEYYDKINQVLGGDFTVTTIHEQILNLNPIHIVTTNYDNLLEKGSRAKGFRYNVVKKDLDLPFAESSRMLIKMHGDLEERNIILKEDDYLHYSKNWPLVESYIQSIFASSLVLFVGFSGSDTNFKYIFQRVKSILGKSSQPAYLIKHDLYDRVDYEYYKEFGINLLYCNEQFIDRNFLEKSNPDFPEEGKFLQIFLTNLSSGFFNENDYLSSFLESLGQISNIKFPMKNGILSVLRKYDKNIWENKGYLVFNKDSSFNLANILLKLKNEYLKNSQDNSDLENNIGDLEKQKEVIRKNRESLETSIEFRVCKELSLIGIKGIGNGGSTSISFSDLGIGDLELSNYLVRLSVIDSDFVRFSFHVKILT
jgi:hypothetical protein